MQGPVNCTLKLAELLCLNGITVTVLNTEHIHRNLLRHTNVLSRFSRYDNFRFETIPDGLPDDHPRSTERFVEVFEGMKNVTEPVFKKMMVSGCFSKMSKCPVTVVIPDGSYSFALDVADEVGVPVVYFETVSPCALWTYLCLPKLIEAGEVPFNGPLHTLFKSCMAIEPKPVSQMHKSNGSNSLWEENRSCLTWLDTKPAKSVIYVSIGSLAIMTVDQFFEIWHGLVNSGKLFLIVKRPGSVIGDHDDNQVPKVLVDATKERGFIAQWVPQEEVLAHSSIGGFLTHSGWNSTMESIVEGVPMICWPLYVDQQVNSRFVSEVWKIGLDIKDTSDKVIIEKAVNDIINVRRNEFIKSANTLAESAAQSVTKDGSSFKDLNRLIKDLNSMDDQIISSMPPQIIVFPSPLQWPSNSMFDLAELLCLSGHAVTFVLIPYTHSPPTLLPH
ncbi:7-deoxyloganetic acid glucosyltransferase-like protein [Tanacetum coccineum]|uniref:Glycosyltransferase n=1 Tax=Tanacetum coccineum TaxID=301880 RepID=A0ABQ5GNV9_9ASTR